MPIDFTCNGCANQLRVSDESAGKDARCPKCGAINRVPGAPAAPFPTPSLPTPAPEKKDWLFNEPGSAAAGTNPFGGPATPNPYAAPAATSYVPDYSTGPIQPMVVGVEPILNHAWQVWQQNLGLLLGVTVTAIIIEQVLNYSTQGVQFALMQNNNDELAIAVGLIGAVFQSVVSAFLGIGQAQISLKLARRQVAEFTDLFGGGPCLPPLIGAFFIALIPAIVAFLLLIVPYILLLLAYWPVYYLIVDKKAGVFEAFSIAPTITKGNWGTVFLLYLLSIGIVLLGVLALCIGVLFAWPLVSLLFATAYLMMSGQLPVYPQQAQYPAYGKP